MPEFGVGIPPRVSGKRWKGILWSLNAIPLGGFVRIAGDGDAADAAADALQEAEYQSRKMPTGNKKEKALVTQFLEDEKGKVLEIYLTERYTELLQNNEMDYFLVQNGLEVTQEWKDQIKAAKFDNDKEEQIKTLIKWEFDKLRTNKEMFYNKPYWAKIAIMLGGITTNFLFAYTVLVILLTFFSVPGYMVPDFLAKSDNITRKAVNNEMAIIRVEKDSVAEKQQLKVEDKIVSLNNEEFTSPEKFVDKLKELGGTEIALKVRDSKTGEVNEKRFYLPTKEEGKAQLGISPVQNYIYKADSFGDALVSAFNILLNFTLLIFALLFEIFKAVFNFGNKEVLSAVGGPVAIGNQGGTIFRNFGFEGVATALALVSVNLGVFNLLPIPALDGGRVVILTLQKILGHRNRKLEYSIISITFIGMLILGLIVMISDLSKL
ncbi:MAG: RIP metalloprotease RseP [Patescibacteria group bacterium]